MSSSFFRQLNFSSSNEDSRSELRALSLGSLDRALCITGSGARALDLLVASPAHVVSLDMNPTQNFLLELKRAAFRTLDYEDMLAFLGATEGRPRAEVYRGLRTQLSSEARGFFDARPRAIRAGVLFAGTWERYMGLLARAVKPVRGAVIEALFNAPDLRTQAEIWRRDWDTPLWRGFLRVLALRAVWKYVLVEPGVHFIAPEFSTYDYFKQRLDHAAQHMLLRESPFASLMFLGHYPIAEAYPPHLRAENFARVREQLGALELVTNELAGYLRRSGRRFDAFSLSDFCSYTSLDTYRSTWAALLDAAKPGARLCERQFMVKRDPGAAFADRIVRDAQLERELEAEDNAFIYSFVVATATA